MTAADRSAGKPSTVLGRQLGDELRRLREAAGMTTGDVAGELDCTKGKVSRIENGRVAVRAPDVLAMLRSYGVDADSDKARQLVTLARQANRRRRSGWWNKFGPVLIDTYRDYIELEAMAEGVRTFQAQLVPGLLQTAEYSRAVTVASKAWQTPDEIERFVQVRMARQKRLRAETPLSVWAVLAEGVLHQRVGGPAVMRGQLEHLLDLAQLPHITVQVLPFTRGAHSGMFGPYVVLSFPQAAAMDVVLTETPIGQFWQEREPEVARYQALFDDARTSALPPTESLALISRVARENAE
ncbi:helix-turn-helix domain-containing protein [Streptomyces aidingensis]|uniref:Helix-turn-helix domain-containing protein n=1 Tax=Streptomyces aidingensis TaxID=910347 RepID=A0A1I1MEX7_9ACTN|nr:helix-turn-helix transcriptional regulator [Streptomyces aidingensis]SFC83745.1 Helix-turn-helix domain-containing protein [Streptomyces aidingensis]